MTTIYNNDLRTLSDSELLYNLNNKVELDNKVTFEEFIQSLTPGKKNFALNLLELYKRSLENKAQLSTIRCSDDIYNMMKKHLFDLAHEEFWVIFLNQGGKPIKIQRFSLGGITSTVADVRLIIKEAILCGAISCALVHNHPSGATRPSNDDDALTLKIRDAMKICNIRLLDHVIFANDNFYSYADEGRI